MRLGYFVTLDGEEWDTYPDGDSALAEAERLAIEHPGEEHSVMVNVIVEPGTTPTEGTS